MKIPPADVEQPIVRLVLEAEEATETVGRLRPPRLDLCHKPDGLLMVLPARAATESRAARRIRRGDPRQDRKGGGGTGVFQVPSFPGYQLRDFEELAGVPEARTGLVDRAGLGTGGHQRSPSKLAASIP